jgi:hypothetical protein
MKTQVKIAKTGATREGAGAKNGVITKTYHLID